MNYIQNILNNRELLNFISIIISLTALIISIIVLIYTIRIFFLKSGQKIRFFYTLTSSIYTEDKYISSFTIENLKDKSIVIREVHLKLGNVAYIELETFDEAPLIIKPFEAYQKILDPVVFYSSNLRRIFIDNIISDSKIKKQLILSTTDGKITANAPIKYWTPSIEFFQNVDTTIIQPRYLVYKNKSYGSNTRYLVEVTKEDGSEEIVPIASNDTRGFQHFSLTKEPVAECSQPSV